MTHRFDFVEYGLNIPEIVDEIGQNDRIEASPTWYGVGVGSDKIEVGVLNFRPTDHLIGKINPDTARRAQRVQEVTVATADLEYFEARRYQ
jgi:hypothetical protein